MPTRLHQRAMSCACFSAEWQSTFGDLLKCVTCLALLSVCNAAGSGRRVGENCEHLWAQLRPLLKLTRYMSTDNYVFVLDDALLLIAEEKMSSFATFMTEQERATHKKLGGPTSSHHDSPCTTLLAVPEGCVQVVLRPLALHDGCAPLHLPFCRAHQFSDSGGHRHCC